MTNDELRAMLKVGDQYRMYNKTLVHIRGFIDDQVVMRKWMKRKQYWEYFCEPLWFFDPEQEFVTKVKSG